MRPRPFLISIAMLSLAAALALGSCGKDDKSPTKPGPTLELNSPTILNGQSWAHVFTNAGTYPYHCVPHTMMTGEVTVMAGAAALDSVEIQTSAAPGFVPQSVTVAPGGTVVWVNINTMAHTVVSD